MQGSLVLQSSVELGIGHGWLSHELPFHLAVVHIGQEPLITDGTNQGTLQRCVIESLGGIGLPIIAFFCHVGEADKEVNH